MEALWKSTIQDMLEYMSPEEVASSLSERYPNHPELPQMVQELSPAQSDTATTILGMIDQLEKERYSIIKRIDQRRAQGRSAEDLSAMIQEIDGDVADLRKEQGLKSLCRRAQMGSGFGYGNEGQSNFSIPNSEGEAGSGNPVDNTSEATPGSGYTDRLKSRMNTRREEEEEQERRKKRRKLLKELGAQTAPGSLLKNKTKAPAQNTQTPAPAPEAAEQWQDVETNMEDATDQSKDTEKESDKFKKTTKDVTDELKDQGDEMKDSTDDTEEFGEAAKKTTDSVQKLQKSLEDLVS